MKNVCEHLFDADILIRENELDKALVSLEYAKQCAERMENRLLRYRYAIESLGFKREKITK
jgi:hypothetical protein